MPALERLRDKANRVPLHVGHELLGCSKNRLYGLVKRRVIRRLRGIGKYKFSIDLAEAEYALKELSHAEDNRRRALRLAAGYTCSAALARALGCSRRHAQRLIKLTKGNKHDRT